MKTIHMKKADWQKWDDALRSGKYNQCRGMLSDDDGGYCCLGVMEKVLDGDVERDGPDDAPESYGAPLDLPTMSWLHDHGIEFADEFGGSHTSPWLPSINLLADSANDKTNDDCDVDTCGQHAFNFIAIADAIAAAVEFTDDEMA